MENGLRGHGPGVEQLCGHRIEINSSYLISYVLFRLIFILFATIGLSPYQRSLPAVVFHDLPILDERSGVPTILIRLIPPSGNIVTLMWVTLVPASTL